MPSPTPGPWPQLVTRVLCTSQSRIEGSVVEQMLAIRNLHCEARAYPGVKGALLHTGGWFLLWLEGPETSVEAALASAAADPRNHGQRVIHRSRGAATLVDMLTVTATHSPLDHRRFAAAVQQAVLHKPALDPWAIWRRLAAGPLPDRHVMVVAAEDGGPLDPLRRLADCFGRQVVYQRLAGSVARTADVGTAYVDVPQAGVVTRVQLLPRRALALATVRRELAEADGLVLVLGSRPAAALGLATAVAECVQNLGALPRLCFSGGTPEVRLATMRLLQRSGAWEDKGELPRQLPDTELQDWLPALATHCAAERAQATSG